MRQFCVGLAVAILLAFQASQGSAAIIGVAVGNASFSSNTDLTGVDDGTVWVANANNPIYDPTRMLNGVIVVDANTAWAVGNSQGSQGLILQTTNASSLAPDWIRQTGGTIADVNLNAVDFSDTSNGWVVGNNGWIVNTADGGLTWASQQVPGTGGGNRDLNAVDFVNSSTGWAVGNAASVLKTTDGGGTWGLLTGIDGITSGSPALQGVSFVNESLGWVVGNGGIIFHTSNGGINWTQQTSGTTNQLRDVMFVDALNGWAVGASGVALKTTDGGNTWVLSNTGLPSSPNLRSVQFVDPLTGWVVGRSATIWHTIDGGLTWNEIFDDGSQTLQSISLFDTNTAVPEPSSALIFALGAMLLLGRFWIPGLIRSNVGRIPV